MTNAAQKKKLEELDGQIRAIREKMTAIRRETPPEPVKDYELVTSSGEKTTLSALFLDKSELFLIHNMGRRCSYCTLWADGFNGIVQHLENRAAFVVSSPDAPEIQTQFAKSRGWKFRMVSTADSPIGVDLGYQNDRGAQPGVSVLKKTKDGGIVRVSDGEFGPGDDFCGLWHLLDLLPEGANGWEPQFAYRS